MTFGLGCVFFFCGMRDFCVGFADYVIYDFLNVLVLECVCFLTFSLGIVYLLCRFGCGMCDFCEGFWFCIV